MAKPIKDVDAPTIKEQIVAWMRRREGEHLTTGEIANAMGIKRNQATSALHNLAKRSMPESVRRVGDGVWMYTSPRVLDTRPPDEGAFSPVGRLSGGGLILVDNDGALWEAHPMSAPE